MVTQLDRVRVSWSGLQGGAGVSTFYFATATAPLIAALRTFYNSLGPFLPAAVTLQVASSGDSINEATGQIVGAWGNFASTAVVATGSGPYASPVGAAITWTTSTIIGGRRLRGRTFIVPISGAQFDSNGTLLAGTVTGFQSAAQALITSASTAFLVYRHPHTSSTKDPRPSYIGSSAQITGQFCKDTAAILRGRRD